MAAANIFSQVTVIKFGVDDVKAMNQVLKYLNESLDAKLQYKPLDIELAKIVVFSDGSHATNSDHSSQLGYLIFLTDNTNWHLLDYKSYKYRSVVRSPLAAETLALADSSDSAILIRHDLEKVLGRRVSITLLTDAKYLFDVISKRTCTSEKGLMIDI